MIKPFRLVTWRKGAQYKFECKVKRTKMVDNVPFVDGNRDEGSVQARFTFRWPLFATAKILGIFLNLKSQILQRFLKWVAVPMIHARKSTTMQF